MIAETAAVPCNRVKQPAPRIGMALWLMRGRSVAERVAWLAAHGFSSVALLPNDTLRMDVAQKREAAAAMRENGMMITYHGNVPADKLTADNRQNASWMENLIDDILWWHENAGGVSCCCSDPISVRSADDDNEVFTGKESAELARLLGGALRSRGIRIGIENSFGVRGRIGAAADMERFRTLCADLDIGLLLDAGHVNVHIRSENAGSERDAAGFVGAIPLDILEVHCSDNNGMADEHKPLGEGNLDLAGLVSALRARSFAGPFTLEIFHGEKTDALLKSRDMLLAAWAAAGTSSKTVN